MISIDKDKFDAWLGSMNGSFASGAWGTWIFLVCTLALLAFILWSAWSVAHEKRPARGPYYSTNHRLPHHHA
jgi:hypothetical protein